MRIGGAEDAARGGLEECAWQLDALAAAIESECRDLRASGDPAAWRGQAQRASSSALAAVAADLAEAARRLRAAGAGARAEAGILLHDARGTAQP